MFLNVNQIGLNQTKYIGFCVKMDLKLKILIKNI